MSPRAKNPDALLIADYLLLRAKQDKKVITNKKLQKLLYYVQAWSAAIENKRAFDDKIEAWVHGPAIKKVYLAYQKCGNKPIDKEVSSDVVSCIPEPTRQLIDEVWQVYDKYDGDYLELLTHSEEPWQKARGSLGPHMNSEEEITFESMRDYYRAKIK
jgi:uncharacterized phage-associated protein